MKTLKRKQEEQRNGAQKLQPSLFSLYRECMRNAESLFDDASILLDAKRYPRAYALAFTAYEEIGKAQIVADYLSGCASNDEFSDAFRSHETKAAYVARYVRLTERPGWAEAVKSAPDEIQRLRAILSRYEATIEYDTTKAKKMWDLRQGALFVSKDKDDLPGVPNNVITKEMAEKLVYAVEEIFEEIRSAEWLNERIGSKALLK